MFLLISTENNNCLSVAVGGDKIEKIKIVRRAHKQAELLLKAIDLLISSDVSIIQGIIVVSGPGAFSSLRIGIAVANALAYSLNIPVVGIKLNIESSNLDEKAKLRFVWNEGEKKLRKAKFSLKKIVKPFYNKEPNITQKYKV